MTELLGLPLDTALDLLKQKGISDVRVEIYTAPRDENTRGTLRIVRVRDGGRYLTVCRFSDSVDGTKNSTNGETNEAEIS